MTCLINVVELKLGLPPLRHWCVYRIQFLPGKGACRWVLIHCLVSRISIRGLTYSNFFSKSNRTLCRIYWLLLNILIRAHYNNTEMILLQYAQLLVDQIAKIVVELHHRCTVVVYVTKRSFGDVLVRDVGTFQIQFNQGANIVIEKSWQNFPVFERAIIYLPTTNKYG